MHVFMYLLRRTESDRKLDLVQGKVDRPKKKADFVSQNRTFGKEFKAFGGEKLMCYM